MDPDIDINPRRYGTGIVLNGALGGGDSARRIGLLLLVFACSPADFHSTENLLLTICLLQLS